MKAKEDIFLRALGNTPQTRLLGYLLIGRGLDYSLSDMVRGAEMSWSTLHRIFPELEKQGIVVKTREIGRAKLYKLNEKNPFVKQLIELEKTLINQVILEAKEKYSEKAVAVSKR